MAEHPKPHVSGPVESNIRTIAGMEQEHEERAAFIDRAAASIGTVAGSKLSIVLHAVWFVSWFLINTHSIPGVKAFDPFPFVLLAVCVSCEGVLLTLFVLFKQNYMQNRADHLNHLNLQIDLLTEKEVTKALQLLRTLCEKLEVPEPLGDSELAEMSEVTSVDTLSERIREDLPSKE